MSKSVLSGPADFGLFKFAITVTISFSSIGSQNVLLATESVQFCYLGDMLSVDGDADAAVEARIRIGWNKFR